MSLSATILVVEDEEVLLEAIATLLQIAPVRYQVHVVTATNGEEALEKMGQESPDLIISDVMMPRMDGYELLSRVRERPEWVQIPFIFLSAKVDRQDVLEGRRRGAELYITKPFNSLALKELVESQLDRTFALRDVQEQNLLERKRDIMKLINHEFRTPLTYVTAYYEMLADSLENLEEAVNLQDYLRGIQTGSKRLTKLVEDLIRVMDFRTGEAAAQFEQGARRIENIGELLHHASRARKREAKAAGAEIVVQIAEELPAVFGQPSAISDAFDRLIDNAIKFSSVRTNKKRNSHIFLRAMATSQYVCVSVEDQGIGFPPYIGEQLFDPFFQYNRERFEQQGSGAGLAIVKSIVDLHQGRLEVSSNEGEGSTFRMLLPRLDAGAANAEYFNGRSRRVQVLVVEDDRFLLRGLQELLEVFTGRYQIQVLPAENGREGLAWLESHRPDLIISDVMMPVMDGYEFLHAVRQRPAFVHIPVIFLTARREPHDIHRGLLSGVEEYIPKPYDVDELLQMVVTQLDRHFQMQVAAQHSLEEIKRGILDLLQPDFKAPLASVDEYTQQLEQGLADIETDEDLKHSLQGIRQASDRLTNLVEEFIRLAKLKTGENDPLTIGPLMRLYTGSELHNLLVEYGSNCQERAEKFGIRCRLNFTTELPMMVLDLQKALLSLGYLFEMVVRTGQKEGLQEVSISVGTIAKMFLLGIRTENKRLPEEEFSWLQRLGQGENWENMDSFLHGSGLSVANNFLQDHRGRLIVENQANGTLIAMLLPIQPTE
jgi:CheY-like chemotaxis protein